MNLLIEQLFNAIYLYYKLEFTIIEYIQNILRCTHNMTLLDVEGIMIILKYLFPNLLLPKYIYW